MDVDLAVFRTGRRITLALGLCLLAVVFALEAKTAWYGPVNGPGFEVRAAKARPADLPQVIDHGVSVSRLAPPLLSFAVLAALSPARLAGKIQSVPVKSLRARTTPASGLSPQSYFRPPPSLSLLALAS